MKKIFSFTLLSLLLIGCKDDISDKSKRNENWVWWIDAKTGKAGWVPVNGNVPRVTDGRYTQFYFNGNVHKKGKLVNGQDADTIFAYDIKGNLQGYQVLKGDSLEYFIHNGPIKIYNQKGIVTAIGVVINHDYGNKWISYFDNGKPQYVRNSKTDTGWATRYYYNGKVSDSEYYEGQHVFNLKHWFENGQLAESNEFKNGDFNGLQKEYYLNGRLKVLANIINGKSNGEETHWFEDGKLNAVIHRKNGVYDGRQIIYYENGNIQFDFIAKDGKGNGESKKYDKNGKLIADFILKDGIRIEDKLNVSLMH